jgi:predicted transposase/invertase (TIGR01784 family)
MYGLAEGSDAFSGLSCGGVFVAQYLMVHAFYAGQNPQCVLVLGCSNCDCYANRFRLYDADSGCCFSDLIGVYVLELPKVQKSADMEGTALYHWMQLLLADSAEELANIDSDDPKLRRAVDMLLQLNEEDAVREEAFRADNARRKAEGERLAVLEKGIADTLAETARKAFAQGLSIETVQAITGLDIDELVRLQG